MVSFITVLCRECCLWCIEEWSSLANEERSEMGLYEMARLLFSFGFGVGMMLESFHMFGMMLVLRASAYSCVR